MKITIRVGQVSKRKGEGFNQRVCIGAINTELKKISASGRVFALLLLQAAGVLRDL
jgi:hypothetical protein